MLKRRMSKIPCTVQKTTNMMLWVKTWVIHVWDVVAPQYKLFQNRGYAVDPVCQMVRHPFRTVIDWDTKLSHRHRLKAWVVLGGTMIFRDFLKMVTKSAMFWKLEVLAEVKRQQSKLIYHWNEATLNLLGDVQVAKPGQSSLLTPGRLLK